jgi:hypothetical protein
MVNLYSISCSGVRAAIATMPVQASPDTTLIDHFRERSRDRFISLDAVRGIAAISVMIYLFGTSLCQKVQPARWHYDLVLAGAD